MSWTKLECPECSSHKIANFLEFKGKNAKLKCRCCGHEYWTDI